MIHAYTEVNFTNCHMHIPIKLTDCNFFIQIAIDGIMKFCLRGLLGDKQRQSFFKLLHVLALLFQDSISADELSNIDMEVNMALALLERDFPISVQESVSFLCMCAMI